MEKLNANPGQSSGGRVGFANGERAWEEAYDLPTALLEALAERGHSAVPTEDRLRLGDFELMPLLVGGVQPLEGGGVQTATTIQIQHPLLFPSGIFEYQYATGDDVQSSLRNGFGNWIQLDLVALLDAVSPSAASSHTLLIAFPLDGQPDGLRRRAVLGPVTRYAQHAEPPGEDHEHDCFCPCCFLTNSMETFEHLLKSPESVAIRFYAAREAGGQPSADCRINGIEYEDGKAALRRYVATWPNRGVEFRKQYVVVHTVTGVAETSA